MAGASLALDLRPEAEEVVRLLEAFEAFAEAQALPHKATLQAMLVLEELAVNIVTHAFPEGRGAPVEVVLTLDSEGVLICDFRDRGRPFDPFQDAPAPDLTSDTAERRVGGLGLHLVRQMVDSTSYHRADGINHVRVTKNCRAGADG